MSRVIFKTIVSSASELAFVQLNIDESYDLVDHFIICEAEFTHTGDQRGFTLADNILERFIRLYPKCSYIQIGRDSRVVLSHSDPTIMHQNEQIIRDAFRASFEIRPDDIVISADADEVLFSQRVSRIIKRLNRKIYPRTSYILRLHQMIYLIGYNWSNCNFQGPTISRASHFLEKDLPQWRYSGARTIFRSGTHFSWVMTIENMIIKIQNYAHRDTSFPYANKEMLEMAIQTKSYIFDSSRKCTIKELSNLKSRKFPKSLQSNINLFEEEVFCSAIKL